MDDSKYRTLAWSEVSDLFGDDVFSVLTALHQGACDAHSLSRRSGRPIASTYRILRRLVAERFVTTNVVENDRGHTLVLYATNVRRIAVRLEQGAVFYARVDLFEGSPRVFFFRRPSLKRL